MSRVLGADLIKTPDDARQRAPWCPGESWELYERLGARDPTRSYVAFWLNCGKISMLTVSEVLDQEQFEISTVQDCLKTRLKLIFKPVKIGVPLPSVNTPAKAAFAEDFWGKEASFSRSRGPGGVDLVVLQANLFSSFPVRMLMRRFGFKRGVIFDVVMVDWPARAAVASFRTEVEEDFIAKAAAA